MADASDDVLESVLQAALKEQFAIPTMLKQYASKYAQPGCAD